MKTEPSEFWFYLISNFFDTKQHPREVKGDSSKVNGLTYQKT